jgi:hypothetical protein
VSHVKVRCDSASPALTELQQAQVLLEGNHRLATTTAAPDLGAL